VDLNITADLRAEIVALSTDNLDTLASKWAEPDRRAAANAHDRRDAELRYPEGKVGMARAR
jgi:hypothetical protein